ncbi:TVP38/TMEM64 family protein [Desulfurivibrio sp. D14AmB]|uniref:TVP38/TMEM64 family protein n=1 Tax=Desulfurivibrio sp. D14AmB TaxID=3374370 RepID=UPI00376F2627
MTGPPGKMNSRPSATAKPLFLLFLLVLTVYGVLNFTTLGENWRDLLALRETLTTGGPRSLALFLGLATLLLTFGTPRLLLFTLGGFLFGFTGGLLSTLSAAMLASFICFSLFRWGGRQWVRERLGRQRLAGWITRLEPSVVSVFLVRLLPISNLMINISLSFSAVNIRTFLLGTFLGFLPLGTAASLIGSGLAEEGRWLSLMQLATAALVLLIFSIWFMRNRQAQQTLAAQSQGCER